MSKFQSTTAQAEPNTAIAPQLLSQIHEAPGRGILPNISLHDAATPHMYQLDVQPVEQTSELLQRQYLSGSNATFVKWTAKKGAVVPLHHHVNEQITWITHGSAEVYSQGRKIHSEGRGCHGHPAQCSS